MQAIASFKAAGGKVWLQGGQVKVRYPQGQQLAFAPVLQHLRAHRDEVVNLLRQREESWPPASLEAERKFGHAAARLYPFLGKQVRTPRGSGQLVQVFTDRVAMLLDGADQLSFFAPDDICPPQVM
ncbi:MAG TPA: hypothetical protein VG204_02720 [Terriglobia bacterium]|nr:hypothetical protein [Terriglobia bacterium]